MTLLRRFLAHRSADVVLAVIGMRVLQYRIVQAALTWQHAHAFTLVIVALAPALIAIRGVDPVSASIGLALGAIGSLLLGQVGWVFLIGLALALWSLATRCRLATSVSVTVVVIGLGGGSDQVAESDRSVSGPIYDPNTGEDIRGLATDGATLGPFGRVAMSQLRWWQVGLFLVLGAAALIYRRWWAPGIREGRPGRNGRRGSGRATSGRSCSIRIADGPWICCSPWRPRRLCCLSCATTG